MRMTPRMTRRAIPHTAGTRDCTSGSKERARGAPKWHRVLHSVNGGPINVKLDNSLMILIIITIITTIIIIIYSINKFKQKRTQVLFQYDENNRMKRSTGSKLSGVDPICSSSGHLAVSSCVNGSRMVISWVSVSSVAS